MPAELPVVSAAQAAANVDVVTHFVDRTMSVAASTLDMDIDVEDVAHWGW